MRKQKNKIEFPITFRCMAPPEDGEIGGPKEYLFEAKSWNEFYITIQDKCYGERVSAKNGRKLLKVILEQQEQIYYPPEISVYGRKND
jgi:hypothetical protein